MKIGDFQVKDLYKRFLFMSAMPYPTQPQSRPWQLCAAKLQHYF